MLRIPQIPMNSNLGLGRYSERIQGPEGELYRKGTELLPEGVDGGGVGGFESGDGGFLIEDPA